MFIDASALVAIIGDESDGPVLVTRIHRSERIFTSPLAAYEATLALARIGNTTTAIARIALERFLAGAGAETVPITAEIGQLAIDAFTRFGRGHHPAGLNMGDCFAYACARSLGVPLLFKGDDFSQTDIVAA
ncbi:MAG TPA: type II toxin-antitoxin system VapC family toxin [Stellaceae bacterium]|jgi:ribonuclease VapC|nr:type II toxin-antitoxin system VapC family toxin [Stellaceae bacterium]